jgi:RNA polymerase sigma-70 factor (ECF subfamily)
LSEALQEIAPEHRAILVLRDVQGLDYEQIAESLDIRLGPVKSRIFRARAALRQETERLMRGESASESEGERRDSK